MENDALKQTLDKIQSQLDTSLDAQEQQRKVLEAINRQFGDHLHSLGQLQNELAAVLNAWVARPEVKPEITFVMQFLKRRWEKKSPSSKRKTFFPILRRRNSRSETNYDEEENLELDCNNQIASPLLHVLVEKVSLFRFFYPVTFLYYFGRNQSSL